ncbi:hypothetical protein PV325_001794 [Microctonus aethiopoides]|uniref:Uncharacterized protein n=1 Tax=Microctonus aethiopoides TaxID=144406 RepID=A0AA39KT41_9HYME|nr:hypothetical protein PV325_001794 [Microctonus aethiopoides]KAK0172631.1 hypothetical protein PV328_005928 [Microctonus aethiopoides]
MILKGFEELCAPNELEYLTIVINNNITTKKSNKRKIYELLFENCANCCKMAAVPQGAFAVRKIREMNEQEFLQMDFHIKNGNEKNYRHGSFKKNLTEEREPTPLKYNSKLMNSIWGEYNRYSVHNFKKNTAADEGIISAAWGSILRPISTSPAATTTNLVVDMKHNV